MPLHSLFVFNIVDGTRCKRALAGAAKIADILNVSLDFLIGKVAVEVDGSLLKRIIDIQQMDKQDKEHILYTIDALIKNVKLNAL